MFEIEYDLIEKDGLRNEDGCFEYNDHEFELLYFDGVAESYKQLSTNRNRKVNL